MYMNCTVKTDYLQYFAYRKKKYKIYKKFQNDMNAFNIPVSIADLH